MRCEYTGCQNEALAKSIKVGKHSYRLCPECFIFAANVLKASEQLADAKAKQTGSK
jgi:hypothetical protein